MFGIIESVSKAPEAAPESGGPSDVSDRRFVREHGVAREIAEIVEPIIEDLGFRLVRVVNSGRDGGTLQIMADRADGDISVENCASISRAISPLLDTYDPIPGSYQLEVSSPGIDRPLVRPSDFADWTGYETKIELREMVDGRKRFRGRLDGFEEGEARLIAEDDGESEPLVLGVPIALIESAKLVMTDELIAEALHRRKNKGLVEPDLDELETTGTPSE